ncbi:unnamed protein product [Peronospora belbahrii]|uniref:Uncharacterized protein n=1 Tax=Peronospora belbahrii TaxID=622444 RepID=A0ABN8D2F5_9STRA|nr:unnamed protein product [Peronospora belbahrii]
MLDPPPDNGRDENGDNIGRPALPAAPIETRVLLPLRSRTGSTIWWRRIRKQGQERGSILPSHLSEDLAADLDCRPAHPDRVPPRLPLRARKVYPGWIDWIKGNTFTRRAKESLWNVLKPL